MSTKDRALNGRIAKLQRDRAELLDMLKELVKRADYHKPSEGEAPELHDAIANSRAAIARAETP